jgi:hypothetical protein
MQTKGAQNQSAERKMDFISRVGLNWMKEQRDKYLAGIPIVAVKPLAKSYPPLGHWVHETAQIYGKWHEHLSSGKLHDKCMPRHPLLRLDPVMLVADVLTNEC